MRVDQATRVATPEIQATRSRTAPCRRYRRARLHSPIRNHAGWFEFGRRLEDSCGLLVLIERQ
jgi:hypothetical protein